MHLVYGTRVSYKVAPRHQGAGRPTVLLERRKVQMGRGAGRSTLDNLLQWRWEIEGVEWAPVWRVLTDRRPHKYNNAGNRAPSTGTGFDRCFHKTYAAIIICGKICVRCRCLKTQSPSLCVQGTCFATLSTLTR